MSDTLDSLNTSSNDTTDPLYLADSKTLPKLSSNIPEASMASEQAQVILPQKKPSTKQAILTKAKKKTASQPITKPVIEPTSQKSNEIQNVADWMDREYRGVSIYAVLMGVLLTLILWTGISTVRQIQAYHHQYTELQKTKKDYRKLQIEHQRLLIEQQTFSATPQIARRAVTELNMFYPKISDRLIVQQPAPTNASASSDTEVSP